MSTKQIEVQLLGKNFNFNIPANLDAEYFMEIVDFVENKVRKIKREAGDLDSFRLGLLVAINITEEFFFLKQENEKLRAVLANIDQMISPTDAAQDEPMAIHFSS
jgi:cell division protein ZapA (FtsZ GTPase activity inhibitor)